MAKGGPERQPDTGETVAETHDTPAAERDTPICLVYDLDGLGNLDGFGQGAGACLQPSWPLRGHGFGCDGLSGSEKRDLVAYLESL